MKFSKLSLSILTGLLSTGLLFGCGQVEDEQELYFASEKFRRMQRKV